jgi:CHAT domain-containing protein
LKPVEIYLTIVLSALFFVCSTAAQQKFEPTENGRRQALSRGQGGEFLAAMEVLGSEAEKKDYWAEASVAYNQASLAARFVGQLQKAMSNASKALELAQRAKNPNLESTAMRQMASAYASLGQSEKEREWLKKAVEVTKKTQGNKEITEGRLYGLLGENYLRQHEAKQAIEYLSYSLQVLGSFSTYCRRVGCRATAVSAETLMIPSFSALGNAYLQIGKPQEAIKVFEQGLTLIKTVRLTTPSELALIVGLGRAYLPQKDFPQALDNFSKALQMAEERRQAPQIQSASAGMADVFLQMGKLSEAIPYYKKAIDSIESTRALLESEEFRTSFFEDKGQIYGGLILSHLGANNVEEAFNYNERARSRAFLDILGSKVQLGKQATLMEEERALVAKIGELRVRLAAQRGDDKSEGDDSQGNVRQEFEAAQKAYTDFLGKVRKENKEQASLMNVEPLTLKQAQELLEPGVTMLEYFVATDQLVLWVVERERVEFVRIPVRRRELVSKVSALRESVLQPGEKENFRTSSLELYKLLIQPALQHIRGKELLIIPHDVLHYLPFQALLSAQEKYLVQDYPVYYLSSASLMQFTREKKRAGGEQALVMGNPSLGDEAYNLRFAEREAKEVANVYPKSAVYLRAEASKSRALALSPKYDMLHFAVHAELNEEDPMSSALLLAPEAGGDGRLKVGEIFSLNLKAGMVVLSACETGLGKLSNGDELIGLTRAFIYAGTPSIITTLWKVNDRASYELMKEFYQHLKNSKKVDALRQAQLTTMKEFPEPFYWAAYQLTGEP